MSMKTIKIIDTLCIIVFLWILIYIFALPESVQDALQPLAMVINPFRTAGWIVGAGFLVTCIFGEGRPGLVWGLVMLVCYLITAFISLFGMIALVSSWELLWYLHVLLLLAGVIIVIRRWIKKRAGQTAQDA